MTEASLQRELARVPIEEEELTPEIAAALSRARASLARGEGIPHEEVLREFGFDFWHRPEAQR
ncbi:MAG: hypothetical protein ACRD3N_04985 [Terracidiphilus sp.]